MLNIPIQTCDCDEGSITNRYRNLFAIPYCQSKKQYENETHVCDTRNKFVLTYCIFIVPVLQETTTHEQPCFLASEYRRLYVVWLYQALSLTLNTKISSREIESGGGAFV